MLIECKPKETNEDSIMDLSAYSIQGRRAHMEDFYDFGYQMKAADKIKLNEWPYEFFYFAIFDGHGGFEAAKYAKKNLARHIINQDDFWSDNDENVMRAIRNGFADTHSAMRKKMPNWSRTSKTLPSTAGTTASILFIKNGKYYTGHVGDSRIVIGQENSETHQWIARQLTEDHKPESEREIERIERAGGQVREKTGVQRVVWKRPVLAQDMEKNLHSLDPASQEYYNLVNSKIPNYPIDERLVLYYQFIPFLAIARSLGDFWSINPYSGQYVVSPEPDVSCRPISPHDTTILLASDGLWNVMDAMKAVRFLQELDMKKNGLEKDYNNEHFISDNYYHVGGNRSNDAQSLVYFAYQIWERKRLRSDNITVVVAKLWNILKHFNLNSKSYSTRSSMQQQNQKYPLEYSENVPKHLVQVYPHAHCFTEKIKLNTEPRIAIPGLNRNPYRSISEMQLILPPTIIEKYLDLVHPKNYTLLSNAPYRVIGQTDDYALDGKVINIKKVTDDPSDLRKSKSHINKNGKKVRESSAQVSDWLHDFGQPWKELQGEEMNDIKESRFLLVEPEDDDEVETTTFNEFGEEVDECEIDVEVGEVEEVSSTVFEDCTENLDELREYKSNNKEVVKGGTTIPQLRCLLNYTPTLRRSKRRIYLSLSENTKRKNQAAPINTSMSKIKRRKSQPVRCNVSRT